MTRQYIEVLNDLIKVVNGRITDKKAVLFVSLIKEMKNDFGKSLSTIFLRDLIKGKSTRIKTYRINRLLKKGNLLTEKTLRYGFKNWVLNKYFVDIIQYTHDEKFKIKEHEKAYIKDIRNQDVGILSLSNQSKNYQMIVA